MYALTQGLPDISLLTAMNAAASIGKNGEPKESEVTLAKAVSVALQVFPMIANVMTKASLSVLTKSIAFTGASYAWTVLVGENHTNSKRLQKVINVANLLLNVAALAITFTASTINPVFAATNLGALYLNWTSGSEAKPVVHSDTEAE